MPLLDLSILSRSAAKTNSRASAIHSSRGDARIATASNVRFPPKTDGCPMFAAPSFLRPLWLGSGHHSASSSRSEKNQTQQARDLKDSGPTAPVVISAFGRKRYSLAQGAKTSDSRLVSPTSGPFAFGYFPTMDWPAITRSIFANKLSRYGCFSRNQRGCLFAESKEAAFCFGPS